MDPQRTRLTTTVTLHGVEQNGPYASVRSVINQNKIPNVRYNNDWPCAPRIPYRYIVMRPYIVARQAVALRAATVIE